MNGRFENLFSYLPVRLIYSENILLSKPNIVNLGENLTLTGETIVVLNVKEKHELLEHWK